MAFTTSTGNSAVAWRPDLYTFEPQSAIPDAIYLEHTNISGRIEGDEPSLRVAFCIDDAAEFVDEGAEIPEAEPELSEAVIYTRKFAQLLRITREQYGQNGTAEELARSVARAMTAKADNALLSQPAPTLPNLAPAPGLVNWPAAVSGTVGDDLDALVDLEAEVRTNGADPTAWILAPSTWAALRKLKSATGSNVALLGAGTDDSERRLLSIPVVVNAQLPRLTGVLVDKQQIISAVSELTVATSLDAYFGSDSVAVRATMRTGHTVPRPGRLGVLYLDSAPGSFTVTASGTGTFTLSWRGNTTAPIAHNASATAVETALADLDDGYTAAGWTVTGSAGGPYTVTTPGGGPLTGDGAQLAGGSLTVT